MKKKLLFVLALVLLFSLVLIGCSGGKNENTTENPNDGTTVPGDGTTENPNDGTTVPGDDTIGNPDCDHSFGDWQTITDVSCEKDGKQSRVCTNCNYTETKIISTKGHIFDKNNICETCKYELIFSKGLEYGNITINNENVYAVTGIGTANSTNIVIPAYHAGNKVLAVSSSSFYGNDLITSIHIPDGVKYIGSNAFYYCISLESVYVGKTLTRIEEQAFYNCTALNKISLGDNITYLSKGAFENTAYYNNPVNRVNGVIYIGNYLIDANQTVAGKYTVKNGTRLIATEAFYECAELTEIVLPDTLHHINNHAFYKCENLGNIDFPKNLSSIGEYAFYGCKNITELILDNHWGGSDEGYGRGVLAKHSEISICKRAFDNTGIVKAIIDINLIDCLPKEKIEVLSVFYAWHKGSKLTFTNFPNLKELEFSDLGSEGIYLSQGVLNGCNNIKRLVILNYKELSQGCLSGLSKLEDLTIPTFKNSPLGYFFGTEEYTGSVKISQYFKYQNQYSGEYYDYYFPETLKDVTVVLNRNIKIEDSNLYEAVSDYAFSNLSLDNLTFTGGETLKFRLLGRSLYNARINTLTYGGNMYAVFYGHWYCPKEINTINYLGTLEEWLDFKNSDTMLNCVKSFTISGERLQGDIVIPDSVTAISGSAFYNCSEITSITIPNSVTSIGDGAFYGCNNLKFNTENNINYLGNDKNKYLIAHSAISEDITSITLNSNCRIIYYGAFSNCDLITEITIPETVLSVGSYAFSECDALEKVYYNVVSCANLPYRVFDHSGKSSKGITFTIGSKVESIPDHFFSNSNSDYEGHPYLKDLILEKNSSLTSIGEDAFYSGTLKNIYISDIQDWLNINFENEFSNPMYIADKLYVNDVLTCSLEIPTGVSEINSYAFYGLHSLCSIVIPDTITRIGSKAFYGCSSLLEIYNLSNLDIEKGSDALGYLGYYSIIIHSSTNDPSSIIVLEDFVFFNDQGTSYLIAYSGEDEIVIIPKVSDDNNIVLNPDVFSGNKTIKAVTFPDNLIKIEETAFAGCSNLAEINIPNGVVKIGQQAFSGCNNLSKINISDTVKEIGPDAFAYTAYYYDYSNWENGVLYIGKHLIEAKTDISGSYSIKEGTLNIATAAFVGCYDLISIIIPDSVINIGASAFYSCNLENIIIGEGVKVIGDGAFLFCDIASINIPNSVTYIGDSAFEGCYNLININYLGSKAEWQSITKVKGWKNRTGSFVVHCTDGDIAKTDS